MQGDLAVTGDKEADHLLNTEPFALLLGMLLDQQVPMEWAFASPRKLKERLGGRLDAATIAAMPLEELEVAFKGPPALHRFPGSMAKRTHQLSQHLVDHHGGRAEDVWADAPSASAVYGRLRALPGYGDEKAKIFLALLAKRFGIQPEGWEKVAKPFSDVTHRSVADVESAESLQAVRAFKQMRKAQGKGKDDGPLPPLKAPRVPKGLHTSDPE